MADQSGPFQTMEAYDPATLESAPHVNAPMSPEATRHHHAELLREANVEAAILEQDRSGIYPDPGETVTLGEMRLEREGKETLVVARLSGQMMVQLRAEAMNRRQN